VPEVGNQLMTLAEARLQPFVGPFQFIDTAGILGHSLQSILFTTKIANREAGASACRPFRPNRRSTSSGEPTFAGIDGSDLATILGGCGWRATLAFADGAGDQPAAIGRSEHRHAILREGRRAAMVRR
jgi:hypothetical protein